MIIIEKTAKRWALTNKQVDAVIARVSIQHNLDFTRQEVGELTAYTFYDNERALFKVTTSPNPDPQTGDGFVLSFLPPTIQEEVEKTLHEWPSKALPHLIDALWKQLQQANDAALFSQAVTNIKIVELNAMIARELASAGVQYEMERFGDGAVYRLFDNDIHIHTISIINQADTWELSIVTSPSVLDEAIAEEEIKCPHIKRALAEIWRGFEKLARKHGVTAQKREHFLLGWLARNDSDIEPIADAFIAAGVNLADFVKWTRNYLAARGADVDNIQFETAGDTLTITALHPFAGPIEFIAKKDGDTLEISARGGHQGWGHQPLEHIDRHIEAVSRDQQALIYYFLCAVGDELNGKPVGQVRVDEVKVGSSGFDTTSVKYLREKIRNYFNIEELKNLCQDMDIPYEDLPAEGREGKVRELIDYCKRYGLIDNLRNECRRLRPHVTW